MNTILARRLITADQFLCMPQSDGAELVDGRIEEKAMGAESAWLASTLQRRMGNHAEQGDLGTVSGMEFGIQCWPDHPNRVRKPDVVFVRDDRLQGRPPRGWLTIVPDIVAEVVSPNDKVERLERKLREYREAGIPLIWVIYPDQQTAQVWGANLPRADLGPDGILDGGDLLPGFALKLSDLFA